MAKVGLSPSEIPHRSGSERQLSLKPGDNLLALLQLDNEPGAIGGEGLAAFEAGSQGALAEKGHGTFQFRPAMRTGNRDGIAVNGRSHGGKYSNSVASQQRELGRILLLSLMCLSGLSFWVGYKSGPYGVAGLTWSFSVLISGATFGVLVGFFAAKDGG